MPLGPKIPRLPTPVRLGRRIRGRFEATIGREWLATNGLGGYAMGSLAGPATRSYHGILVAALDPPVARTVLVAGLSEWATVAEAALDEPPAGAPRGTSTGGSSVGRSAAPATLGPVALHCLELADGTFEGDGWRRLEAFELEGSIPVWTYALADVRLVRRLWFAHGTHTVYVRYELHGVDRPLTLEVAPLLTRRDHHLLTMVGEPPDVVSSSAPGWLSGLRVTFGGEGPPLRILADAGRIRADEQRVVRLAHREETARGQPDRSEASIAGTLVLPLRQGRPVTLALTVEPERVVPADPLEALGSERAREASLLLAAGIEADDPEPLLPALVLAADAFVVSRTIPDAAPGSRPATGRSVIAGYPWFNDWGRDTMISLPGLMLATGRHEDARVALRAYGRFVRDGLVPDTFPDASARSPEYNAADPSFWYVLAIEAYRLATGDEALIDESLPVVVSIVDRHVAGTRSGIRMDPADGLIVAAEPGVQLTWMDAKVDGWVVTPRMGKPVEIEALWVNALRTAAGWLDARGVLGPAGTYRALADRAQASFRARFWRPDLGYLADVVDGPDGDDLALRPNQLLAVSLPHPLLDRPEARAVLETVTRALVTPLGLRSLAPSDPAYHGRCEGDRRSRDAAYHQGTVWPWLIGPYLDAVLRLTGDREAVRAALAPFRRHLSEAGLGSISEIFDGDPPFTPRGCIAQAWSVAEVLRILREVGSARPGSQPPSGAHR